MADPRAARWLASDLSERLRDAQSKASARAAAARDRRKSGPATSPVHVPA